jgi:hypothetical protein
MSSVILVDNKTSPAIDTIELDAVLGDSHPKESEGTESPVERGADMTDHCRPKPDGLELEAIISDVRNTNEGIDLARVARARDALTRINREGTLVTVVTGLGEPYENMQLRKLNFVRSLELGNALQFQATFKQVKIVDTLRVKVARGKKPTGTKATAPPDPEQAKKVRSSIARDGVKALKKRFGGS